MPYTPPAGSLVHLKGVPFEDAEEIATEFKKKFDDFDETEDGQDDPSLCRAILRFPDDTVFWDAKMAICADGPANPASGLDGEDLDPGNGVDETAYNYPGTQQSLIAELVSYIVMPKAGFAAATGIAKGDVAIVIYKDKIAAAVLGEVGPAAKIGEGSIRLHEMLHPPAKDPCIQRHPTKRFCKRVRNESIPERVLYFVFPGTKFGKELRPATIESLVSGRAFERYNQLRGIAT